MFINKIKTSTFSLITRVGGSVYEIIQDFRFKGSNLQGKAHDSDYAVKRRVLEEGEVQEQLELRWTRLDLLCAEEGFWNNFHLS